VHERYHELNGYMVEAKAKQILAGLGFKPERTSIGRRAS
jgi:ATPase subunit of ABC transporter with duplicated ATPase domains